MGYPLFLTENHRIPFFPDFLSAVFVVHKNLFISRIFKEELNPFEDIGLKGHECKQVSSENKNIVLIENEHKKEQLSI